jgi:hypothetical protein
VVDWLTGPDLAARLAACRETLPGPDAEAALEAALGALRQGHAARVTPPGAGNDHLAT